MLIFLKNKYACHIVYISTFLIFLSCKDETFSSISRANLDTTRSSSSRISNVSKLPYSVFKLIKNPYPGMVVYDWDNLNLRFYDGSSWNYLDFFNGKYPFMKYLYSLQEKPTTSKQIGYYNGEWHFSNEQAGQPWIKIEPYESSMIEFTKGNNIKATSLTVSNKEKELFAHDSRVLIDGDMAYVAYYSNDKSIAEGERDQTVRLSTFNVNNPSVKKVYSVFEPNTKYKDLTTSYDATYSPMIFLTKSKKIRILARVAVKGVEKYYYRDFDPFTNIFENPKLCKLKLDNSGDLLEFNNNNIVKYMQSKFGASTSQYNKPSSIYFVNEPVYHNGLIYLGLTVGQFSAIPENNFGTTLMMNTVDAEVFNCLGAPIIKPTATNNIITNQFVEGSFDFTGENEITILGRNDISGILLARSIDGGLTFSNPYSLNKEYGYNTINSKPYFKKIRENVFMTAWNVKSSYRDMKTGLTARNVLHIRCGSNKDILGNKVKIAFKTTDGCHYPSFFVGSDFLYMTYSLDKRRLSVANVGEIGYSRIKLDEITN